MKILIAGASGYIGSALVPFLENEGHEVIRLSHSKEVKSEKTILWDPARGMLAADELEGFDAMINLSGENVAGFWTTDKKKRIRESRVKATQELAQAINELKQKPKVFINASAVGYYGNRGDEILTEQTGPGTGFLAEVCQDWERAAEPISRAGVRLVLMRTGLVISPEGGALEKMLIPFKLGLGGVVGDGKQYWSWITLEDLIRIYYFAITHAELSGPINAVTPLPVSNLEFTKTLGSVLNRPTVIPLPGWAARFMLGEMADELLLSSARVLPEKLQQAGFTFIHPNLEVSFKAFFSSSSSKQ